MSILVLRSKKTGGYGGSFLRSKQVVNLAKHLAGSQTLVAEYPGLSSITISNWLLGLLRHPLSTAPVAWRDPQAGLRLAAYAGFLNSIEADPETIFWEPHTSPMDVAGYLIRKRWPRAQIIAFPQNVEALVPKGNVEDFPNARVSRFRKEVQALGAADIVAGISNIDTQIFSLFGLPAVRFPYIPELDRQQLNDDLRKRRESSKKNILLILGSAQNPPTRMGMETQFRMIDTAQRLAPKLKIVLAGRNLPTPPSETRKALRVVDSPTDAHLSDLFLHARALWVHQALTTGSLVRVADALSAGLPVIGNLVALQEYSDCPGTFPYDETPDAFAEAMVKLLGDNLTTPRLLPDPGLLERALLDVGSK